MIRLDATTRKLQAVLSGAVTTNQLPCLVSYSDKTSADYVGASQLTNTNSTTAVDICSAPAASTVRDIDYLSIRNRDTAAATVTVMLDDSATDYEIIKATLAVGDQLVYTHGDGWRVIASDGTTKIGAAGNYAGLSANTFTGVQRWAKGADVASASALTLGTDGNYFDITGTTTITSIGSLGVGTWVKLHFDGALTLTHHATDLVLAGAANITTAAGDEIEFAEYASGDWRMVGGVKADGTAWVGGGANVAVAGTFALSGDISPAQITADQNDYSPTGLSGASVIRITTDSTLRVLTGLAGGADGRVICIDYLSGSGGLKLADDSASSTAANRFDLAADVTLTAPCVAVLKYDATSSRWRVMASPSSGAGKIKQIVFAHKTDTFSTASTTYTDLTGLSVSLTPTNSSNKVLILASVVVGESAANHVNLVAVRDSTVITQGDTAGSRIRATATSTPTTAYVMTPNTVMAIDSPGDTSAHTYKLQMSVTGGTGYVNRSSTDTDSATYSRSMSTIIALEYEP